MGEALVSLPSEVTDRNASSLTAPNGSSALRIVTLGVVALGFAAAMMAAKAREFPLPDVVLSGTSGLLFVLAGLVARVRRPDNRVGTLMVLTGFALFVEDLQLVPNSAVFTVGRLLSAASLPAVVHLVLAFPSGWLSSRLERGILAGAFAHAFGFSAVIVAFQPRFFTSCDCYNLLSIRPDGLAVRNLVRAAGATGMVLAAAVVVVLVGRWGRATPPMRRVLAPVVLVGMVGAVASAADATARAALDNYATSGFRDPLMIVVRLAFWALPVAFLAGVLRFRLARAGVGGLLLELQRARSSGELGQALARALGDPSVEVLQADPASGAFVDAGGAPRDLPALGSGRAVALLERQGRPIGALIHDDALVDDRDMVAAVSSVAALALDNERLAAQVRSQLEEVQRSRSRIVEAGDAERRRLERDLHDGAQQRLVTLALRIRMARRRLNPETDPALDRLLNESAVELDEALLQLRELARGIHPAVLTDSGLVGALESLAERAPVRVHLTAALGIRLPIAVETAAYYVAAEALTNALKHAQATTVNLKVEHGDGRLWVEVADDGVGGADPVRGSGLVGLFDRVAALGGSFEVSSPSGGGTHLRASIPCP